GATAMAAMAKAGGHPIGCTQATEILATPGVRLVAPLPAGFSLETVYTATAANAGDEAAVRFVRRLAGRQLGPARHAMGFHGYAIHAIEPGEAPEVRALVAEVLGEFSLAPDPDGVDSDLADPAASYVARGGIFEVASGPDGKIAGC